jgi:hypothetical protein
MSIGEVMRGGNGCPTKHTKDTKDGGAHGRHGRTEAEKRKEGNLLVAVGVKI